jgi:hypothetical protein
MQATAYAAPAPYVGTTLPTVCNGPVRRSLYGDAVLVLFLLAQCFDGVFTYVGVLSFGLHVEANPVIAGLMAAFGSGPALAGAKIVAGTLGILLHVREVHNAVAALTAFYLVAAIGPWTAILFF